MAPTEMRTTFSDLEYARFKGSTRAHVLNICRHVLRSFTAGTPLATVTKTLPKDCTKCDECQRLLKLRKARAAS